MSTKVSPTENQRRPFSPRRAALLASAGLGAVLVFSAPQWGPQTNLQALSGSAQAQSVTQNATRPVGFADIVEKVKPAVIGVRVKVNGGETSGSDSPFPPGSPMERFFRRFGPEAFPGMPDMPRGPRGRNFTMGQGSGFFISPDGYAVTNNHVVEKADSVEVTTDDGKTYTAKVIGTDPKTDLALIKVDGRNDFPYARLADHQPRIGDWVLAVGNPFGLGGTVTAGIVSARGRDIGAGPYDDFLQIDAPVNKGNSGGPAFDVDGNVVGVNTAIFSPSGGSVGIAFAIPSDTVRTVVSQLKEKGVVTRGWIGVQIQPVTDDIAESLGLKQAKGALVAEPQEKGPAAKAGIKSGDVITSVNGESVKDARDLAKKIGSIAPGSAVKLGVIRDGSERTFDITLGEYPREDQRQASREEGRRGETDVPRLGLTLAPADGVAGAGNEGVVVTDVEEGSPAARNGFRTGDVILDVAGKAVSNPSDVRKALSEAQSGGKRSVLMRVKTGNNTRFVAVPVNRG